MEVPVSAEVSQNEDIKFCREICPTNPMCHDDRGAIQSSLTVNETYLRCFWKMNAKTMWSDCNCERVVSGFVCSLNKLLRGFVLSATEEAQRIPSFPSCSPAPLQAGPLAIIVWSTIVVLRHYDSMSICSIMTGNVLILGASSIVP